MALVSFIAPAGDTGNESRGLRARLWHFVPGAVLICLAAIAGYFAWQANRDLARTETNYQAALGQVDALIDLTTTRLEGIYGMPIQAIDSARAAMEQSIERLKLDSEYPYYDRARGRILHGFARVYYRNQHRGALFEKSAQEAGLANVRLLLDLLPGQRGDQELRVDLADAHELLGDVFLDGRHVPLAEASLEAAVRWREQQLAIDPDNPRRRLAMTYTSIRFGDVALAQRKRTEATERYRKGLSYSEALNAELPADHELRPEVLRQLSLGFERLGDIFIDADESEALGYYRRATCLRGFLARPSTDHTPAAADFASSLEKLSTASAQGAPDRHAAAFQALRIRTGLAAGDPYNEGRAFERALSLWNIGKLKRDLEEPEAAYAFIWTAHANLKTLIENGTYDDQRFPARLAEVRREMAAAWQVVVDKGVQVNEGDRAFIDRIVAEEERAHPDDLTFSECPDLRG